MSTRVLSPGFNFPCSVRMSDLQRRLQLPPVTSSSSSSGSNSPSESAPANEVNPSLPPRGVRRNLFGPIDHEENLKFVHEELNKIADADARRWNYDFVNDTPLEGRYSWESTKQSSIPSAYEMPNLTSRLTQTCSSPNTSKLASVVSSTRLPQVTSSTVVALKGTPPKESEKRDPLRVALEAVTTASTTVIGTVSKTMSAKVLQVPSPPPLIEPVKSLSCESKDPRKNKLPSSVAPSVKQTHITDFLKIRKRPHSPSEADGKGEDPPPALLPKRTRTST